MNHPTILLDLARIRQREMLKDAADWAKGSQATSTRHSHGWLALASSSGFRSIMAQVIGETAVKRILAVVAATQP